MKKKYIKPVVAIEKFIMDGTIANGLDCGAKNEWEATLESVYFDEISVSGWFEAEEYGWGKNSDYYKNFLEDYADNKYGNDDSKCYFSLASVIAAS